MNIPARGLIAGTLLMLVTVVAFRGIAMADLADQRTTELLTALETNDYAAAQRHCSVPVQSAFSQVETGWQQVTQAYGKLESFEITSRTSANGMEIRIANLNFERPSGLAAKVAIDSDGNVTGLLFVAAAASPEASKVADQRVTEMLEALRDSKFDVAESHFDSTMQRLLPPKALENAWKPRTDSLGELKAWRIVGRSEVSGVQVRIVNLDFTKVPKAFALKIAVDAAGEIGGLYFIPAQSEASSTSPSYIRPATFTAHEVKIGRADAPLGGTLTIPVGKGPFPGAVLVAGSGANDRDENVLANHPFKDLAEGLSSNGIAVLRYDKRTHVYPDAPVKHLTVDYEVIDDAVAAVAILEHQPRVDPARVYVVGHSLGATLAPEIAARAHAAGVIMLAPGSLPLSRILVRQYRYLGAPEEKIAQAQLLEAKSLPPDQQIMGGGAPASYFYDLDSRDEIGFARKLCKPILILHGARDYQVGDEDIAYWRKGLKGTPGVTIETIPKLNHLFIAGSGRPSPDEYSVPGYVDPEVIAKVSSFIKQ
jgi:uncharacterized protein